MSGRIDYAKAKRRALGYRGEPREQVTPIRRPIGWRTRWPHPFPVTTTRTKDGDTMDTLRIIDYNGHVPDELREDTPAEPATSQDERRAA